MTNYRRSQLAGASYFFTVNLADRTSSLLTEHIVLLREAFAQVHMRHPFSMDAAVILPEHLHTIWTLPADDHDFSTRWRLIKTRFSHALPYGERLSRSQADKGERGIWQRRFWEHLIRDEEDFAHHVDYIHINPVKHGWVTRVADWPHSSFHRHVQDGRLPLDWAGDAGATWTYGERK